VVDKWSTNVPVSMPKPVDPASPVQVDFGGFAFTTKGICHNVSQSDIDEMFTPFFSPQGARQEVD
jgi:hypothetical protein